MENILSSNIWQYQFLGNSAKDFVVALGAFVVFLVVFKVFQLIVLSKLKKLADRTATDIDDTLIQIVRTLRPPFYTFLAFYFALNFLALSGIVYRVVTAILVIWIVYQAILSTQLLLDYVIRRFLEKDGSTNARSAVALINILVKAVLWGIGLLFVLSNLGVNVTSFIAGLGIGGIAFALAIQNILTDLFSSIAIYFDKPFETGDFIVVGDKKGTVQKIGLKTTRIESLHGEEIIISNQVLTSAQILNYKKMQERRAVLSFGVTYDTPIEKLKKIPSIVKEIVEKTENSRFDRIHFSEFGDSALNFELVYFMTVAEYKVYADKRQDILFRILEEFDKMGVEMAFPTRTIYMKKD